MEGCIFCKIVSGAVPAAVVYRNERVLAIEDLDPQAPTHLLVLPVEHYATIADAAEEPSAAVLTAELVRTAARLGRERGGESGFRLVVNTGSNGGQTVEHLHVHVLAGRRMSWPPG